MNYQAAIDLGTQAALLASIGAAIALMLKLRVFRSAPLAAAPVRQSTLSLPVIGVVIVTYFVAQIAVVGVGLAAGWVHESDVTARAVPAATTRADAAASAPVPASTTAPATQEAKGAPTPGASDDEAAEADRIVKQNLIGDATGILTAIVILAFVPWLFKEGWRGWGLHWRQLLPGIPRGILGFIVTYPAVWAFSLVLLTLYEKFSHEMSVHSTFEALEENLAPIKQFILDASAVVCAPFLEELFFRGIVQTTLIQFAWGMLVPQMMRGGGGLQRPVDYRPTALHRWGAIVITSLAFAWMHQSDQAPIIFVLSLGLGYVYERTGILWAPMILHCLFNSTEVAQYYLNQN